MFRQVKVDILGIVENMSFFVCPHCQHEIDIFSKGGGARTAQQFDVPFLGKIESDPDIRREATVESPSCWKATSRRTPNRCLPSLSKSSSGQKKSGSPPAAA